MGKKLRVIGTHCYLGGFLIGLQKANLEVIRSLEPWKPGMVGAQTLGLPSRPFADSSKLKRIKSNIVVGNPPCSRFSPLSVSFFKKNDHEDIKTFPEILDLAKVAHKAEADTIWWENGPLAWTLGRPLLYNFHEYLKKTWGETTTLIIRVDLRSIGIPHKRPRTHIIHRATKARPPGVPHLIWSPTKTLGEWVQSKTKEFKLENPVFQERSDDPLKWANKKKSEITFRSMVPKVVSKRAWYSPAVVSRRLLVWKEENRWFDLLEYAALMTYPLEQIPKLVAKVKTPLAAQVLISKSVAPDITKWIADRIVSPWITGTKETYEIEPTLCRDEIWELDLRIPPKMERAFNSGQKRLL